MRQPIFLRLRWLSRSRRFQSPRSSLSAGASRSRASCLSASLSVPGWIFSAGATLARLPARARIAGNDGASVSRAGIRMGGRDGKGGGENEGAKVMAAPGKTVRGQGESPGDARSAAAGSR